MEVFAEDASAKLRSIQSRLGHNSFKFEPAKGVPIPKLDGRGKKTGKFRPIVLAPVESRVVQRAILNVLLDVPTLKPFVQTPYSFGGIRGERGRKVERLARSESISAVPAAIKAVLDEIGAGARFVASADIRSFFTRISKDAVTQIIAAAINDGELIALFRQAIDVELSNMAQLRDKAVDFPIEDIGVAQGNSLSPLLGNIVLADFDREMNEGDCRCIRYIDDFIILAPSKAAATARLRKAANMLKALGMELSPEKSSKGGTSIDDGFDFLGVNLCLGAVRPGAKAQAKILRSVQLAFEESLKALRGIRHGQTLDRTSSLSSTLRRVDGMIDGWGKHYWFCNDTQAFLNLDVKISESIRRYLGEYTAIRAETATTSHQRMLGISELRYIAREPFNFPAIGTRRAERDRKFAATLSSAEGLS
ncbi:MAG: RNA-dependent DNA polymerase [Sphingomonas sp.]|uniref:reverse transcriptase domain-containing protein n=1 Tax=Sphingomonas sp. TaxID=28214 RepID=UPI001B066119|nr:reverse transcriptase domain-containing protein [Sphingomonas sp.]MBO9622703.1 RNA-dependent DNA polymerase [Sphingomonas sp.]